MYRVSTYNIQMANEEIIRNFGWKNAEYLQKEINEIIIIHKKGEGEWWFQQRNPIK